MSAERSPDGSLSLTLSCRAQVVRCNVKFGPLLYSYILRYVRVVAGKAHLTAPRSTVARVRLTASVHCGVKASGSVRTSLVNWTPAPRPAFPRPRPDARHRCYAPHATSEPCPSPGPCRPCSYRRAAGHRTPTRTAGRARAPRSGGSATGPGGRPRARSRRLAPRAERRNARATVLRSSGSAPSLKPRVTVRSVNERGFTPRVPDDTALKTRSLNTLY